MREMCICDKVYVEALKDEAISMRAEQPKLSEGVVTRISK